MTNPFLKQTGKTATDLAKHIAKQVAREPLEIGKTIKSQIGMESANPDTKKGVHDSELHQVPQVSQAHEGNAPAPVNEAVINAESSARLANLQEEVRRLIEQRKQATENWSKMQSDIMGSVDNGPSQERPLIQPTSKKKTGFAGPAKGKQGTKEVGKSLTG